MTFQSSAVLIRFALLQRSDILWENISSLKGFRYRSDAEIAVLYVGRSRQDLRIPRPDHAAAFDDVMAIGNAGERVHVLVDDQDRLPAFAQEFQATPNLFTDQWRKPFGGFVENDEPRIGHQRATDRQHLL